MKIRTVILATCASTLAFALVDVARAGEPIQGTAIGLEGDQVGKGLRVQPQGDVGLSNGIRQTPSSKRNVTPDHGTNGNPAGLRFEVVGPSLKLQ